MPQYLVYHNENFIEYHFNPTHKGRIKWQNLKLVCKVNAPNLEIVFRLTNHIDYSWWRNKGIVWWRPSRSTSVGDVIQDMETELYYSVEPMGFKEINPWWIGAHMLEKDMPNEPQRHNHNSNYNRPIITRIRELVSRKLHHR